MYKKGALALKKLLCVTLVVTVAVLNLTACNLGKTNIDKMLKAPALTGEIAEVDTALKEYTGNDIVLVNPKSGKYKSAYILKDIDNDANKEAFVFYSKKFDSNVNELHLNFLKKEESWESVNDILINGDSVNEIDFIDINNDANEEVFIGANSLAKQTGILEGYSIEGTNVTQCFEQQYTVYSGIDIDNDGTTEIVTVKLDTQQKTSVANAYKIDYDSCKNIGTCFLDGKILSYKNVAVSKLTNGSPALFLDAYKNSNSLITEIVYWNKSLIAPFYDSVSMENTITLRNSDIESKDYNKDGYYEIPFLQEFSQTNLAEDRAITYMTQWRSYDSVQFHSVANELANYPDGYALEITDDQVKSFILKRELKTKERIFYSYNAEKKIIGNELFRIKTFTAEEWKNNSDNGYVRVAEKSNNIFAIKTSSKNFNIETLSKMFKVLD